MASGSAGNADFFPLSVNYEEKLYAVGKIPGGFLKREGKASEKATLSARLIDRPLRPLFDKGFRNEVQVVATVMSVEYDNLPEITASSALHWALHFGFPFAVPSRCQRRPVNGEIIINPDIDQRLVSDLNLTVAGTQEAILMVEPGSA